MKKLTLLVSVLMTTIVFVIAFLITMLIKWVITNKDPMIFAYFVGLLIFTTMTAGIYKILTENSPFKKRK